MSKQTRGWMVMKLQTTIDVGPYEDIPMSKGVLGIMPVFETRELAVEHATDDNGVQAWEIKELKIGKDAL